ncbi:hypothetical protein M670_04128 [Schinkia azotoformans MEV2011]|uniref:Uncharacterized protein n=1 Tax=Schinkia azotoformans MEV2011 TaxID=1348973 RepID=A0A072NGS8_SCHAZ|nr:hypothetical protein M670_04128 [Schinkia azotoformans MEV2011]
MEKRKQPVSEVYESLGAVARQNFHFQYIELFGKIDIINFCNRSRGHYWKVKMYSLDEER